MGLFRSDFIFTGDLNVSLQSNKTFGRYSNGDTIPASGKTTPEVLKLALIEPIPPTVSLTSNSTVSFNQTSINNILSASNTINSLNASIKSGYIEYKRGSNGDWTKITQNTTPAFGFSHTLTDTSFNSNPFNYRYTVEDTAGGITTGNVLSITPSSYVSPTISNVSVGSDAELGNISTTLSATINRNSTNVNLTSYQLQYQSIINGVTSAWTNIGTSTSISGPSAAISRPHNDTNLVNASSISYRVQITDTYQTTTLNLGTRLFSYKNYFGYSTNTTLTLAQIQALTNSTLSNSKTRTISSVTAPDGNYTYYCYPASEGNLTSVILDGASQVLTSFTKLPANIAGTNTNGASVTYIVYKSNSTKAFTNMSLAFN
jgi:hypothetical protein